MDEEALTEAALDSLALIREGEEVAPSRVILAIDVRSFVDVPRDERDTEARCGRIEGQTWDDVAAIFIDEDRAKGAVRAVCAAESQEAADQAVWDLWEYSLLWYSPVERPELIRQLRQRVHAPEW